MMELAGWPDREPTALDSYTDFVSPHFNALAILAALDYRERTGKGQYLDLSQYEDCVHFMTPLVLDNVVNGRVSTREGNRLDRAAPHNAYRCRGDDRWCTVAVFTDEEWAGLCEVIEQPDLVNDPRFWSMQARKENEEELDRIVECWTLDHSAEEVMSTIQAAGVGAGVVENAEDLLEHDPQLSHRRFFRQLDHPEVGIYRAPRPPYILSRCDCELKRAPLLGEHNEYVLKEVAGYSEEEIADLIAQGVVE
jgi:benzylsuccinate CoA-transferase BbsF subunit